MPVEAAPLGGRGLGHCADWERHLPGATAEGFPEPMHRHEATGRPLGGRSFVQGLEALPGRKLMPRKPGPKPKVEQKGKRS